jgi:spectinomycin phosphotransferase/16S rRNA (guanine(1405)-N(7))-methyltransferase
VVGVLSPPEDLSEHALVSALARGWALRVASMAYRPVGFGSHHWQVTDAGGTRWFITVDELATKRLSRCQPLAAVFDRLRAALAAATDLRESGHPFAVAPVAALDGEPVIRLGQRFSLAVYPFVDGRSFGWGQWQEPAVEHRRAVLDLIVAVHQAPAAARRRAPTDDFAVPLRDELAAALAGAHHAGDCGPYATPAARLLAENAAPIRRQLTRYDTLAAAGRGQSGRSVLTHGEPHPGNTMLAPTGLTPTGLAPTGLAPARLASARWLLIDWDTAMIAPPERDLCSLDPGDGSILASYTDTTGVQPLPAMLQLYRLRWDLADLALAVSRFRAPHTGSPDDNETWNVLHSVIANLTG